MLKYYQRGVNMDNETLATELLKGQKQNAKRWFIAFLVVLCLWFATIAGFIVYLSLPDEVTEVTSEAGHANYIGNDLSGVINNNGVESASSPTEQAP